MLTRQSTLIEAMRFPLIVMVVVIHSASSFPTPTIDWSLDGQNIYHYTVELISQNLCGISTRCFFLISGFLFFRFLKEGEFGFSWILSKWKKRFWSLFVPYLIWNLLMVLAVVLKSGIFDALSIVPNSEEIDLIRKGPVHWFITGPADFPFWYIRDLIIMTLLAPLLYLIFKRFRWISLALMIGFYIFPISITIPKLSAIFYFSIGSWLGIHKFDILPLCKKVAVPAAILAGILLPLAAMMAGRPMHSYLFRGFIPVGIISFVNLCDVLTKNKRITKILCALSGSVFFIYGAHEIYIMGWSKGLCLRIFGDSLVGQWLRYLFVPIIVTGVCLALYWLMSRLTPKVLSFMCGGRVKSVSKS